MIQIQKSQRCSLWLKRNKNNEIFFFFFESDFFENDQDLWFGLKSIEWWFDDVFKTNCEKKKIPPISWLLKKKKKKFKFFNNSFENK